MEHMASSSDALDLLKTTKDLEFNFKCQKYVLHAMHRSKHCFFLCNQGHYLTTNASLEMFQNTLDVISHRGGMLWKDHRIRRLITTEKRRE
jgi:hypothetical protein